MPPAGGEVTGELRHKPETHVGAAVCSAAWGASCRRVRFCRLTAHPCRFAQSKRRVRPPWRREENRMKNFDWVILFGHSKPISIPRTGERKPNEPETVLLAGRITADDEHDRRCRCPRYLQSRSLQTRAQRRLSGVSDRQTHRCLAGKLPRLAEPAVHRTKMRLSAKSTRYFTVFVVVV